MKNAIKFNWLFSGAGYDADFQAILSRASALGYALPGATILRELNSFFVDEKVFIQACNLYYVFANGGGHQNFTMLNWAENANTHNLDYPTAIAYGASGVGGNATDRWISTNWNASTNGGSKYTQNSASRGAYVEAWPNVTNVIDGTLTTANRNSLRAQSSTSVNKINQGSNNLAVALSFTNTGEKALCRYDSTNVSGYNNGVKSDTTSTSAAMTNEEQVLLRTGASVFGDVTISKYFAGPSFTQGQFDSQRVNYALLRTALGL